MVLLPQGFTLPPLVYLVPILLILGVAAGLLWTLRPAVTDRSVLAVVPWMVAGAAGHVLYIVDALPPAIEPLFGVPAVYLTVAAVASVIWLIAEVTTSAATYHDSSSYLFGAGSFAAIVGVFATAWWGMRTGDLALFWPGVALIGAVVLTAIVWAAMRRKMSRTVEVARTTGLVVVFGHGLDGVSTAIGIDVLGGAERSPISDAVIYIGSRLPIAPYVGDTWLFVVVKIGLAVAILALFREYLEEAPSQARVLLAIIAAVGLGPGVYNLLLFTLSL